MRRHRLWRQCSLPSIAFVAALLCAACAQANSSEAGEEGARDSTIATSSSTTASGSSVDEDPNSADGDEAGDSEPNRPVITLLSELNVGACIDVQQQENFFDATVTWLDRSCSSDHDAEVVAVFEHPRAGRPHPNFDEYYLDLRSECEELFTAYVGTPVTATELRVEPLVAGEQAWTETDDYDVTCLSLRLDMGPLSVSLRNAGTVEQVALAPGDLTYIGRLESGACFSTDDLQNVGHQQLVTLTDCPSLHRGQILGEAQLPGPYLDLLPARYDLEGRLADAEPLCQEEFTRYTGLEPVQGIAAIAPTPEDLQVGASHAICVFFWNAETTEYAPPSS